MTVLVSSRVNSINFEPHLTTGALSGDPYELGGFILEIADRKTGGGDGDPHFLTWGEEWFDVSHLERNMQPDNDSAYTFLTRATISFACSVLVYGTVRFFGGCSRLC